MKITATIIKKALQQRHKKDVFISECKTGPSWDNPRGVKIIDFWAMARSWSKPAVWGYEIKVSRQDFLNDNKWQAYLPYCTDFYFVYPKGIIEPDELPQDVGLLIISKTGTRLYCKRKAVRRRVAIPESIYRYILMARAEIVTSTYFRDELSKKEFWRQWLKDRRVNRQFGRMVSMAPLPPASRRNLQTSDVKMNAYRGVNQSYEYIKRFAKEHGVNLNSSLCGDPPCLREIGLGIKDGQLVFFPQFRSWDLWGGLPANLGGLAVLQKDMAGRIGVGPWPMCTSSKGLHVYGYAEDFAWIRSGLA